MADTPESTARQLTTLDGKAHAGDTKAQGAICQESFDLLTAGETYRTSVRNHLRKLDPSLAKKLAAGSVCADGSILFTAKLRQADTPQAFGAAIAESIASMDTSIAAKYFEQAARAFRIRFPQENASVLQKALDNTFQESSVAKRFRIAPDGINTNGSGFIVLEHDQQKISAVNLGAPMNVRQARSYAVYAAELARNIERMEADDATNYVKAMVGDFRTRFSQYELSGMRLFLNSSLRELGGNSRHFWIGNDFVAYPIIAVTPQEFAQGIANNVTKMPKEMASGYFVEISRQFRENFPGYSINDYQTILNKSFAVSGFQAIATSDGKVDLQLHGGKVSDVNLGQTIGADVAPDVYGQVLASNLIKMAPQDAMAYFKGMARQFRARFPDQNASVFIKAVNDNLGELPKNVRHYQARAENTGVVYLDSDQFSVDIKLGDIRPTESAGSSNEFAVAMTKNMLEMLIGEASNYFVGMVRRLQERFPQQEAASIAGIIIQAFNNAQVDKSFNYLVSSNAIGQLILQSRDGKDIYALVDLNKSK